MIDIQKVRELRAAMRACLPIDRGQPITDEMLSACLGALVEVWSLRIWCSPEKRTGAMTVIGLMRRISGEISELMQRQATELLPHAKTVTLFRGPE